MEKIYIRWCCIDRLSRHRFTGADVVGGAALAFYDPRLAIGAGCLAFVSAALSKAGAMWWFAGVLILAVG